MYILLLKLAYPFTVTVPGAWPSHQLPQTSQLASGVDQLKQQLLLKIDPQLRLQASEWTEHKTPDDKVYFFHIKTQQSVWVKPDILVKLEGKILLFSSNLFKLSLKYCRSSGECTKGSRIGKGQQ